MFKEHTGSDIYISKPMVLRIVIIKAFCLMNQGGPSISSQYITMIQTEHTTLSGALTSVTTSLTSLTVFNTMISPQSRCTVAM